MHLPAPAEGLTFPGRSRENTITTSFENLGLSAELLRAISEQGYTEPTPVQKQAIPLILAGRDVLAAAQTGTGKTAGFTLPILQRLAAGTAPALAQEGQQDAPRRPRVLVLVPTRELAAQVQAAVRDYGRHLALRSAVIFGGVSMNNQIDELARGVDIVVATPGRLLDHAGEKTIDLGGIGTLVLDEADRMLDMGFIHDIRRVLALLPSARQNLLFSATFSDEIRQLAGTILHDPAAVEVAPRNTPVELIAQVAHPVDRDRRRALLCHLIKSGDWRQVLVFSRTKHGANRLAEQLTNDGIEADAIHGNKSQGARTRALKRFKDGELRVLVATDIAARGLDIEGLPHVVNYDLPNVPEDYVHRIGRTGRAGSNGEAVALVCGEERELLAAIEKLMKRQIEKKIIEGFEPGPGYETARFDPDLVHGRGADAKRNGRPQGSNNARTEDQRGRTPEARQQDQPSGADEPRNTSRRPAGPRGNSRRPQGQSGEAPGSGPSRQAQRAPNESAALGAAPRADDFSNDEDIDRRIDGNRADYPVGNASRGNNGGGERNDSRRGQSRWPRPAPVLQGPMTSRGQPVASQNRPLEPHESRLHEYATRPQNGNGDKRRKGALLTGLPRDDD